VDRQKTFSADDDRLTYLRLLQENLVDAEVGLLGWCLMSNHLHLVATPAREDSLSVLMRRVHGRYSQYYNIRMGRSGHLWQNRFFACMLGPGHLWAALAYVERNPVRAGMVAVAADYRWSSAAAHLHGKDEFGILDMGWWEREALDDWGHWLGRDDPDSVAMLRRCTYSGRPFGDEQFVETMAKRFGRSWTPGRPKKPEEVAPPPKGTSSQFDLF